MKNEVLNLKVAHHQKWSSKALDILRVRSYKPKCLIKISGIVTFFKKIILKCYDNLYYEKNFHFRCGKFELIIILSLFC